MSTSTLRRCRRFGLRRALVILALPLLTVGCASQDKMDQTVTANRSLREQLNATRQERDQAQANLSAVQSQLAQSRDSYRDLQRRYEDLSGSITNLDATNAEYMSRIAQLEIGPLPIEVQSAIEALALSHPELLSFDPEMGLVRFASDFTFDLGSAELKPDASATLAALASIINEPGAQDLEARIVGHTDDVRIRKAETRQKHPTNMHLSVHRSIAVAAALTSAGVEPSRIMVAGYGEYRPIVPNAKGGTAANRRVEIYLARTSERTVEVIPIQAIDTPTVIIEPIEPMK